LLVLALSSSSLAVPPPSVNIPLVNATFGSKKDSQGFLWDLHQEGYVRSGTNGCFQSAAKLQLNGSNFKPTTAMMTKDGTSFVLGGPMHNCGITRRIHLDQANCVVRYVETIQNLQDQSVTMRVNIYNMFPNCRSVATNKGRDVQPILEKGENGVVAISSTTTQPSIFVYLASANAKIKPVVNNQGNRYVHFVFDLTIAPKQTVSIAHAIAQRHLKGNFNADTFAAEFEKLEKIRWTYHVPSEVRKSLVNLNGLEWIAEETDDELLEEALGFAADLDVEPKPDLDVLVVDDESRLEGELRGEAIQLMTRFGEHSFSVDQIAAVKAGGAMRGGVRLFLRNGEIISGENLSDDLSFTTTSGINLSISLDQVVGIVMRTIKQVVPSPKAIAFLTTTRADRLAITESPNVIIQFATAWANGKLPLNQVWQITAVREPQPMLRLDTNDGSNFAVLPQTRELKLNSARFGEIAIAISSLKHWRLKAVPEWGGGEVTPLRKAYFVLVGNNKVIAELKGEPFALISGIGELSVNPQEIGSLRVKDDEGANTVEITLRNGETMIGKIKLRSVSIEGPAGTWQVPIHHLREYHGRAVDEEKFKKRSERAARAMLGHLLTCRFSSRCLSTYWPPRDEDNNNPFVRIKL
jgi:hypothetical protein